MFQQQSLVCVYLQNIYEFLHFPHSYRKRMDFFKEKGMKTASYLDRESGSSSSDGSAGYWIHSEIMLKRLGKHAYLLNPKELEFERLHCLKLKFISLVRLMNTKGAV